MLRQLYEINRKSLKWCHRLLFGLLNLTVVNAYVVHNVSKEQQLLFVEFWKDLAMGLLTRTFVRGCRSSGAPKRCKIAYSMVSQSNPYGAPGLCKRSSGTPQTKSTNKRLFIQLLLLLLLSASPYSGSPQRESIFHFSRSTSSPSLAPTLSMSSLAKSIHLLFGLPLFLLPGTAISIIVFPT